MPRRVRATGRSIALRSLAVLARKDGPDDRGRRRLPPPPKAAFARPPATNKTWCYFVMSMHNSLKLARYRQFQTVITFQAARRYV